MVARQGLSPCDVGLKDRCFVYFSLRALSGGHGGGCILYLRFKRPLRHSFSFVPKGGRISKTLRLSCHWLTRRTAAIDGGAYGYCPRCFSVDSRASRYLTYAPKSRGGVWPSQSCGNWRTEFRTWRFPPRVLIAGRHAGPYQIYCPACCQLHDRNQASPHAFLRSLRKGAIQDNCLCRRGFPPFFSSVRF